MSLKLIRMRNRTIKKFAAAAFSMVYVQVNVAWAGVPSLPVASSFQNAIQNLFKTKPEIFVFHAPWYDRFEPPKLPDNPKDNAQKEQLRENKKDLSLARTIGNLGDVRLAMAVGNYVGGQKTDTPISRVPLLDFLKGAGVKLTKEDQAKLEQAFGAKLDVRPVVEKELTETGQTVVRVQNANSWGVITINPADRTGGAKTPDVRTATVKIESRNAAPAAAAAAEPKAAPVSATVPEFSGRVISSRDPKTETKANLAAEQKLAGTKVKIGDTEVRLKMDPSTKTLIPTDVKTGARITDNVFKANVKDALGVAREVSFAVHHVEMEGGQLIAKGPMTVEAGVRFKDGQLGKDVANTGAGRELGGTTSRGLNITTEGNQIFFEGKAGGGEVAFAAAVTETGDVAMDQAQFNPITAGSSDVTILSDLGTVLAEVGAQKEIKTDSGKAFAYAQWNVVDKAAAATESGKAILGHFNVSETNSALINDAGVNVGQVSFNDKKELTQIIGNTSEAGQSAMKALFFDNPKEAASSWKADNIEVGMMSSSGRAVVILNDKATFSQTLSTLKTLDGQNFQGKTAPQISQAIVGIAKGDSGAQKIDLTVRMDEKDTTAQLRISSGRDSVGAVMTPTLATSNVKVAEMVFGKTNVESAKNTFNSVLTETGKAPKITDTVFSQTGTSSIRVTGTFVVPGTENKASITVAKNDADGRAPPTVQYDRNAATFFHSETTVAKNENAANKFLESKGLSAAKGDFTYSASLNQLTVSKTFDYNVPTLRAEMAGSVSVTDGQINNFSLANAKAGVEIQMDNKATLDDAAFLVSRVNGATPEAKEQSLKNLFTDSNKARGLLGASVRLTDTTVARANFVLHENKLQPMVTLSNIEKQTSVSYFGAKMNFAQASKELNSASATNFKNASEVSTFFKGVLNKNTFDKGLASISLRVGNDTFTGQFVTKGNVDIARTFAGISITKSNTTSTIQYRIGVDTEIVGGPLALVKSKVAGFLEKTGVTKVLQRENMPSFIQSIGKAIASFKLETRAISVDGTKTAVSLSSRMDNAATATQAENIAIDVFKSAATSIDKGLSSVSFAREGRIYSVSHSMMTKTRDASGREVRGPGAVVSATDLNSKTTSRYVVSNQVDGRASAKEVSSAVSVLGSRPEVETKLKDKFFTAKEGLLDVSREIDGHVLTGSYGKNVTVSKGNENKVQVSGAVLTDYNSETKTAVQTINGVTATGERISDEKGSGKDIAQLVGGADSPEGVQVLLNAAFAMPVAGVLSVTREIGDRTISASFGDNVKTVNKDGTSEKVSGADITLINNITGSQVRTIGDATVAAGVMNELDRASNSSEVRTVLENTFENGTGKLLSAGRTIDNIALSGSHFNSNFNSAKVSRFDGQQVKAVGAAITETNLTTGVSVQTVKGFELRDNGSKSTLEINGVRAGNQIAGELTKAEGRDGVATALETIFSKPQEGVLSAGRDVLGYSLSGQYKDGEAVAQGKANLSVTGANITEVNQLTGTVASWMVGTSLLADSKTVGPAINTRSGARALATQVDRAESWSDAAEILSSGLQKPLAGVSVTREFDGVVVSGSHRNGLKTGDGITASGASVEITDLSTSRTVQIVTGKGVTADGKEVTVNGGLKAVDGIAQKLDSAKNPDEVKNALVDIFKTGVEGVVRASREIDGKVVSGEHGSRVEVKDKSLATGAVLTTTDKALDTTVRTIVGNYLDANGKVDSARSIDGRKTGEKIAETVGAAKGVEGTAAALKNIFGQFQEGVLGASRIVDNHVVSGRHGSDTTTGPKPETRWGAVLTDLNLKTGVSVETFNDKTVDGWSAGQSASANIGKEWTLSGTVYALKSEFGKKVDGLRSASREVDGHALSATYQEGVHVRGLDQNEMKAQGAVIRDTNLKTGMTVTTMNGVLLDKENRSYGRLDGYSSGQVLARDADMTQVGNEAKKGQLLSWGVLSVEQRNADGSTLRIDMKADMPVQDASNKEMGQFTGGLQSLISESGQIVTALVGNISRDGVKEEVDQRANMGAFQNEVSGKNYTEARQAAADLIKPGNLKEGVYSFSNRSQNAEYTVTYRRGENQGKNYQGAVVTERNTLTNTTTEALVGTMDGHEVNGVSTGESLRGEMSAVATSQFSATAKQKFQNGNLGRDGVLSVSRQEGNTLVSVSPDSAVTVVQGEYRIVERRNGDKWDVVRENADGKGGYGEAITAQTESREKTGQVGEKLGQVLSENQDKFQNAQSADDLKALIAANPEVTSVKVKLGDGQYWVGQVSDTGTFSQKVVTEKGEVELDSTDNRKGATRYAKLIDSVYDFKALQRVAGYEEQAALRGDSTTASRFTWNDGNGGRITMVVGDQDTAFAKNGKGFVLRDGKAVLRMEDQSTDLSNGAAELKGARLTVKGATVNDLEDTEIKALRSLGLGQASITTADGKQLSALVSKDGKNLEAYKSGNEWRSPSTGKTLTKTFAVEGIEENGGRGTDIVNIQNGKISSRAQARVGKEADALAAVQGNNESVSGWEKLVSGDSILSVQLFNRDLELPVSARGNIVLSKDSASGGISKTVRLTQSDFEKNSDTLIDRIGVGQSRFTVETGRFGADNAFTREVSYSHVAGTFLIARDTIRVTATNADGHSVSMTMTYGNAKSELKKGTVQKELLNQANHIEQTIRDVQSGVMPDIARSVQALDKNGNGAEVAWSMVFSNDHMSHRTGKEEVKVVSGRIVETSRESSVNGFTTVSRVFFKNGEAVKRVTEVGIVQKISELNEKSGLWEQREENPNAPRNVLVGIGVAIVAVGGAVFTGGASLSLLGLLGVGVLGVSVGVGVHAGLSLIDEGSAHLGLAVAGLSAIPIFGRWIGAGANAVGRATGIAAAATSRGAIFAARAATLLVGGTFALNSTLTAADNLTWGNATWAAIDIVSVGSGLRTAAKGAARNEVNALARSGQANVSKQVAARAAQRSAVEVFAGTGFNFYLRDQAAKSIGYAIDVTVNQGWTAESRTAIKNAVWNTILSEIYTVAPFLSSGFNRLTPGAKANFLVRSLPTLGVGVVGAGVGVGFHMLDGKDFSSSGMSALRGFLSGVALSVVGRWEGKTVQAWGAKKLGEGWAARVGGIGIKAAMEISPVFFNALAVASLNGVLNFMDPANANSKLSFWGTLFKDIGASAYTGAFGGGLLRATSGWGNAFGAMTGKSIPSYYYGFERLKAGVTMGVWEVVFNTGTYSPGQLIGALFGAITGEGHAADNRSIATKFLDTTLNIGGLHPFFSLGRVGQNLMSSPFELGLARLSAKGLVNREVQSLVGAFVLNPINIKTFEFYETYAVVLAEKVGLVNLKENASGDLLKAADGSYIGASDQDEFKAWMFRTVGFLNAPVHEAMSHVAREQQSTMGKGERSVLDVLPLGEKVKAVRALDREEANAVAREIQNTSALQKGEEGSVAIRTADGRIVELDRKDLNILRPAAAQVLVQNAEFRKSSAEQNVFVLDGFTTNTDGSSYKPVRETEALKNGDIGKKMDRDQALTTVLVAQSGRREVDPATLKTARERLGIAEGDILVRVDSDLLDVAQKTYVDLAKKSALPQIIEGAARGQIELKVGVLAVAREHGVDAANVFAGAAQKGASADLLSRIGKQDAGLVQKRNNETVVVLPASKVGAMFKPGVLNPALVRAIRGADRVELVLSGSNPGLRISGLSEGRARQILDKAVGQKFNVLKDVGLIQNKEAVTLTLDIDSNAGLSGVLVDTASSFFRGQAYVDVRGAVTYINVNREVAEKVRDRDTAQLESGKAEVDRPSNGTFVTNILDRPAAMSAAEGVEALAGSLPMFGSMSFVESGRPAPRVSITVDESGRITNAERKGTGTQLSDYYQARGMADRLKSFLKTEGAEKLEDSIYVGMSREGLEAAAKFHETRANLLLQGFSPRELADNRELQALHRDYVTKGNFESRVKSAENKLARAQANAEKSPDKSNPDVLRAIAFTKQLVQNLKAEQKAPTADMLDRLLTIEIETAGLQRFEGVIKFDLKMLGEMEVAIKNMPTATPEERQAQATMLRIYEKVEEHINPTKDSPASEDRILGIANLFTELRKSYGLQSQIDAKSGENSLKKLDPMFSGAGRMDTLRAIFKTEPSQLNIGQRMAFSLAITERFFEVHKNGKALPESDINKSGLKKLAKMGSEDAKAATIRDTAQGVLLLQFMLGRIGGLEAGAGKSPVFLLGIGDYVMSGKAQKEKKNVGELVVFAGAEVTKYLTTYKPLATALGLAVKDGRDLAGHSEKAKNTFTAKPGEFNLVVSDLHSRGFLERQLRAEPKSDVAVLVKDKVGVLGLDEVDALLLSRMSFISSDEGAVAKKSDISRVRQIATAVAELLGVKNLEKPGDIDVANLSQISTQKEGQAYYRDFRNGAPTEADFNRPGDLWFSNVRGEVKFSNALLKKIESALEGKGIKGGEIQQVLRALVAVSDKNGFGFSKGENGTNVVERGTHKSNNQFSHGQIDSSMTFNVAAVLFERSSRFARNIDKTAIEAALPMADIRLSEAGSMATFVQVLQRNIHRFGATGTPKALEGLSEKTIGVKIVDVAPSTFKKYGFSSQGLTVDQALTIRRAESAREQAIVGIVESPEGLTKAAAGRIIMQSIIEGKESSRKNSNATWGFLFASAKEDVLRTGLVGYLDASVKQYFKEKGLTMTDAQSKALGDALGKLESRSDLFILGLVDAAKKLDLGDKDLQAALNDATARIKVIDGEGNAEAVAENAATGHNVVFATAVGTRALSYNENRMDMLLAGIENFTTEGWLQALARTDRGTAFGSRRTIVMDTRFTENQIKQAKAVDRSLREEFGESGGLFRGGSAEEARLTGLLQKDFDSLSAPEKIQLAAAFSSLENKAASALFFINEQTTSKLIKEPLQAMIARETSKEGKAFLEGLYRDILSHSDRVDLPEGAQGARFVDPATMAANAFRSGAMQAFSKLQEIASNKSVSRDIRQDAVTRMADILNASTEIKSIVKENKGRTTDAAFVSVPENGAQSPAALLAQVTAGLTEYLLPNTSTTKAKEGAAAAVQQLYSARNNLPDATSNTRVSVESFADSLHSASFNKDAAPKSRSEGRLLNETEQAVAISFVALNKLENKDRLSLARGLYAAGMISSNPGNKEDMAPSAQVLAAQVVTAWMGGKGSLDQFDFDAVVQAAAVIGAVGGFNTVEDKRDAVINVASTPGALRQEAIARNVVTLSKNNPGFLQERAQRVVDLTQQSRAKQAEMGASQPSSSNWIVKAAQWVGFTARALTAQINSPDKQLKNLGKNERLSDVLAKVRAEANGQQLDVRAAANQAVAYIALTRPNLTATTVSNLRSRVVELYSRSGDETKTNATVDELLTWAGQDKATSLDQSNFDKAATDSMKVGESKLAKHWMTGAAIVAGLSVATLGLATAAGAGFAAWMGLALVNGFALNNVSKALVQVITGDRQSWAAPKIPFKKDSSAKTQNLFETVRTLVSTPNGRWTLGTTAALTAAATLTFGGMLPVPVLMGLSIGGSLVSQLGKKLSSRAQAALILSVGALVGIGAMQIPTLAAFGMSAATMEIGWVKGLLGTGGSLAAGAVGAAVVWGAATGILNVTTTIKGETREKALARIELSKQATAVREQIKKENAETEKDAFAQKGGPQIELKGAEAQLAQIRGDKKAQQQNFEGWFSALQRVNGRIDELKKEIREKAGVSEKTDVGDLVDGIEKAIADGKIDPKNKYLVLKYALMQEGLSEKRATEVAAKIKAGEKEDASAKEKKDADTLKVMTADELKDEKTELGLLIEFKQFELALERRGQPLDARAIDNYGWTFRGETVASREQAAVAVYNHLFGRETTADDRRALKRLSENLESFSGSLKTEGVKIPSLRELAGAINQGTAATFFSDALSKSKAVPELVQAASQIANERKDAMGKIRQELANQGLKPIEIDHFMARLFRYDSYSPAQQAEISGALDQAFQSDKRETPADTRKFISAILTNTVFNPTVIARRGIADASTLTASSMKMLEAIAYSRSEKVSANFNNWGAWAPLYRTLSLLKFGSSSTVAFFDGAKNELTLNTVDKDGVTLIPVARLQRSWSGNEVVVELVESNSVIRFGATELSVEAKNKTKVETKVGGTENWTSVPTAQLVTTYLVSNGISEVRVGGVSFNNPLYGVTSETAPEAKAEVAPAKPATPTTPETPATPQAVESRAKIPAPPAVPQPNAEPVVVQREAAAPAPAASAPAAPASAVATPAAQEVAPVPAPVSTPVKTSLVGLVISYALLGVGRIENAVKTISADAWKRFSSLTIRVFDNLGLTSLRKIFFGAVLATAALFGSNALRAQGPNIVNVPVVAANVPKMQFQSVQPFAQTFLAASKDKTERVFARTVDRTDGGVTIGAGREFRQVTLVGAPSYETGAIRELAQRLLAAGTNDTPVYKAGSVDNDALDTMQNLLSSPQVRDWVRAIDVRTLLNSQALPSSIETNRFQTLGQVADLGREASDFKSFVYKLVLFNAESLATRAGTMLSSDSVSRVSRELGGNIVLHHTQPGRAIASLEDRLSARRIFLLGGRMGHVNDLPLIVSSPTELTFFDDIRSVLLTMDALGQPKEVKPVSMPYQNFDPSAQDFVDRVNHSDREASPAAKALAKAALNLAVELFQEKNLSPDQLRLVWGLVQELALGHAVRAEDVLSRAGLSGLGLEQIISELSQQIRELGETNPALRGFAANGHLRDIGPHIHYYLNVSATPANPAQFDKWIEGSEASWIIANLGLDIDEADQLLLDPAAARERAEELREIVNEDAHAQDVFATLRILAGLYESDFFTRMLGEMKGRFTTMAEVEAALAGNSKDRAAQETALRLLMKPLIYAVLEATQARNPELVDQLMKQIDLAIVSPADLPNGKSRTIETRGRLSIQIGLEDGLTTQQAFVEGVGRLTHEISDVLAHRSLKKYALGELGVPTVLSEAWSALTTERALRWLKLDSIANILALQTAERIAEMEESQAYYLTYQGLRGKPEVIAALERKVKASQGATRIVVLASENEFEAAQLELGARGLQVASPAQILKIVPANGETALEAHGRLYLGTRAVKLVADEAAFRADSSFERIVMVGGRVVPELLTLLSPIEYTSRLEKIVQEQLTARLVGRQA